MEQNKKYWKGLEELNNTPDFTATSQNEFAEALPVDELFSASSLTAATPRRDFLKTMGFGIGAVTLASCNQAPVNKAIPYLIKPEEVTPGVANYYASTFNGYGVLVKTREGRPIKIEGNPACVIGQGGTDAIGQASVLGLYDSGRMQNPSLNGSEASWEEVDAFVKAQLELIYAKGKKVRILSSTIISPSTKAVIAGFIAQYPMAKHVTYDAVSSSAIINANKNSFDKAVLPSYHFEKADIIVSFGADFLGTWISPVEFTKQYSSNRKLKDKRMSRHIQFE
ncbi:MAG TPA: TAT-variant-translocated molybdopterin oxidoreductase, partial [Candidatus Brocadiales bacterium]|nr:TAT-variant-translocated molybdopterin oxidoreductase [Candidatus Brocadiales bacterium]